MSANQTNAVDIKNLSVEFRTDNGIVKALNNLDLSIAHGKTLGLVGETLQQVFPSFV